MNLDVQDRFLKKIVSIITNNRIFTHVELSLIFSLQKINKTQRFLILHNQNKKFNLNSQKSQRQQSRATELSLISNHHSYPPPKTYKTQRFLVPPAPNTNTKHTQQSSRTTQTHHIYKRTAVCFVLQFSSFMFRAAYASTACGLIKNGLINKK